MRQSVLFFLGFQSLKAEMHMCAAVTFISVTNHHLIRRGGCPSPSFTPRASLVLPSCLPHLAGTDQLDFQLWTEVQGGQVANREPGASLQCSLLVTLGGASSRRFLSRIRAAPAACGC